LHVTCYFLYLDDSERPFNKVLNKSLTSRPYLLSSMNNRMTARFVAKVMITRVHHDYSLYKNPNIEWIHLVLSYSYIK
jgi:hypothetical protein